MANCHRTHEQNLAEVYETEIQDIPKALESYELAASWYVMRYTFCGFTGLLTRSLLGLRMIMLKQYVGSLHVPEFKY